MSNTNQKLNELETQDVVILGSGLAGSTLAIQLKNENPQIKILVVEKCETPYPIATHKVGESTVEISARYFSKVLKCEDHLDTAQLRKFGLRFFFSDHSNEDITNRPEYGTREFLSTKTYQLDRGIFENYLIDRARALGVRVESSVRVRDVELAEDALHKVFITHSEPEVESTVTSRWVVDASGRGSPIKKRLKLA